VTPRPVTSPSTITISDFRLGRQGSNILATFSVHTGRLNVHGVRLVEATNGGRFVGWPRVRQDEAGNWRPLVRFPAEVTAQVRDLASAAWKAATAARPVQGPPDDGYPF
jgi:hypothetical protein